MEKSHQDYRPGHCWYYLLGGRRPTLKEIREDAEDCGCRGYLAAELDRIDRMSEPTRTARLRELRGQVVARLAKDVAGYRAAARNLALRRASGADAPPFTVADGVHVAMSLKHSHLANDFAHLHVLDELLSRQLDLFGGRL